MNTVIKKILCESKTRESYHTHVSMGVFKSKYYINRYQLENFYSIYKPEEDGKFISLAEKPQNYTPVLVDIDIKRLPENANVKRTNKHITDIVKVYQQVLKEIILNITEKDLTCIFLDKPIYTDNNYIKNGFHLHFPYIFLNREIHEEYLTPKVKEIISKKKIFEDLGFENSTDIVDNITRNAWLIYGAVKDEGREPYKISKVFNSDCEEISLEKALIDYPLLNNQEKIIKLKNKQNILDNITRILSISLLNKNQSVIKELNTNIFNNKSFCFSFNTKNQKNQKWEDCSDEIEEYSEEIKEIVENYITENLEDCFDTRNWNNEFLHLKRTSTSLCPTTESREHDNRDAYITINKNLGKVFIGCFCNEGKNVCIGNYKLVQTSDDYKKIKKIRKDRRTTEQQKILDNVNNKILDKQIENLFTYRNNIFIKKEIIHDSVKYVKDIVFPEGYRCVGIHAGLGCGKTSSLIRKVKEMPENSKVLILSPRITFSKNICAEYNSQLDDKRQFTCYLDYRKNGKNQKEMNFLNKIVMSMEGIHYLESFTPDLLIIDEVNANLISHVSVETNGKNIDNNIHEFKRLLTFSKNVVVADAFLGSKVCNFFTDLKIPLHVYKYERKLDRKDAVILKSVDKEVKKAIKDKISNKQKQKERIYNISQSQRLISKLLKEGKKIHAFFSTRSKLELQQKLSSNYNCLFYSGVSQNEIPDNLNNVWSEKDLVANTCTITVGINHDRKNVFHTKLINFQSSSKNNVSDAIQSHYRVRNIIDDKIYVEVDEDNVFNNIPINIDELNERLEHKVKWYSQLNKNFSAVPEYLNNLIKHNYIENQLSQTASLKMMIRYLKDCNYNIVYDVEIQDSDDESDEKVDEDEDCEEDDEEVNLLKEFAKNCPNFVRFKELEDQKLKRKLTEKELEEMNKYWFINLYTGGTIKGIKETKLPTIALAYRLWKAKFSGNKTIRAMRLEKMVLNGIITIEELVEKRFDKTQFAELQSGDIVRVKRILEVCNKLGLKHSNDTETIITQESIDDFYEEAHEEYDEIRRDMNLEDRRKIKENINQKQFTGLIKGCFTNCESSLCTMKLHKSERKKVKGKVVRTNTYKLYPNDKIHEEMKQNNRTVRKQNEIKGEYFENEYQDVSKMIYENLEIKEHDDEVMPRLMRQDKKEEKEK